MRASNTGVARGSARAGRHWKSGRCLRIGVVVGGRIVEERLLSPGGNVTVGSDAKNTVVVRGAPRKFTLIETRDGGGGRIHLLGPMRGKITRGPEVVSLDDASAASSRGRRTVRLGPLDRGKVRVGDTTLLFQFVRTPPTPARGRSAKRFGGWRWETVDWLFLSVILLSGLIHTAGVMWVESQPPPTTVAMREIQSHFIKMIERPTPPPAPETAVADGDGEGAKTPAPEAEVEPPPSAPEVAVAAPPDSDPEPIETPEEREARLTSEVEGIALLGAIAAYDKPGARRIADLFADGAFSDDVREAVALAGDGRGRARRNGDERGLRGGSAHDGVVGGGDLAIAGGDHGGDVQKESLEIVTDVEVVDWDPPESGGSYDVRGQMKRFLGRFKQCYEKEIKNDVDLQGKIVLSWTIDTDGRPYAIDVEANTTRSAALEACIVRRLQRATLKSPGDEIDVLGYPLVFSRQ